MGTLVTLANIRADLSLPAADTEYDTLLTTLSTVVEKLWDSMTLRTWSKQAFTEYYNGGIDMRKLFLRNFPVDSSASFSLWDDPDWGWNSDDLISSSDYFVDYTMGVVYYVANFNNFPKTIKVTYTAGYTVTTFPDDIRQALVRQAIAWYQDSKLRKVGIGMRSQPGIGTETPRIFEENLLPELRMLAEIHRGRGNSC